MKNFSAIPLLKSIRRHTALRNLLGLGGFLVILAVIVALIGWSLFHSFLLGAIFLTFATAVCCIAYMHRMYRIWQWVRSLPKGRFVLSGFWIMAIAAGEWSARNNIHEAMGLHKGDVPYTYATLSLIGAILCAAFMLSIVLMSIFWGSWIFHTIYTMAEKIGVINFLDYIVSQRAIQFLLRLRKGTRIPRLDSDYSFFGFIIGGFFVGIFVASVVISLLQGYLLNRGAIVRVSVYCLDALDSPINEIYGREGGRLLTVDRDVYRMTMRGTDVTCELMPAKPVKP